MIFSVRGSAEDGVWEKFRRWVRILCADVSAEIVVNGEVIKLFRLLSSVR